jgi:hypothetical protein
MCIKSAAGPGQAGWAGLRWAGLGWAGGRHLSLRSIYDSSTFVILELFCHPGSTGGRHHDCSARPPVNQLQSDHAHLQTEAS